MQKNDAFEEKLKLLCTLHKDFNFKKLSTIKIGPICKYYAIVHSTACLIKIIKLAKSFNKKYVIVGCASNILFCGEFFDGVVVSLSMKKITLNGNIITVFSGAALSSVCAFAKTHGLSGLEWAVGIPASVGGAVAMNAGAFNGQVSNVLTKVYALNLKSFKIETFTNLEYLPKHHESVFTNNLNYVIIKAQFCLTFDSVQNINQKMLAYALKRAESQKVGFPNLGSVFKRGSFAFAPAFYVESCGLKGFCVGDACVSLAHSGFIVNKGKATANDVLKLIEVISKKVKQKFNFVLEPEIIILESSYEH